MFNKKRKIIVKDNVDIISYSAAVQDIANKFFDEDGDYAPHFARIYSIGVFFDYFVDGESLKMCFSEIENDDIDLDFLLKNEECLKLYNKAVAYPKEFRLDFANAFRDAKDIAEKKSKSFENLVDIIQKRLNETVEKFTSLASDESIDKLSKISEDISNGSLNAESIVNAFTNSIK